MIPSLPGKILIVASVQAVTFGKEGFFRLFSPGYLPVAAVKSSPFYGFYPVRITCAGEVAGHFLPVLRAARYIINSIKQRTAKAKMAGKNEWGQYASRCNRPR